MCYSLVIYYLQTHHTLSDVAVRHRYGWHGNNCNSLLSGRNHKRVILIYYCTLKYASIHIMETSNKDQGQETSKSKSFRSSLQRAASSSITASLEQIYVLVEKFEKLDHLSKEGARGQEYQTQPPWKLICYPWPRRGLFYKENA